MDRMEDMLERNRWLASELAQARLLLEEKGIAYRHKEYELAQAEAILRFYATADDGGEKALKYLGIETPTREEGDK